MAYKDDAERTHIVGHTLPICNERKGLGAVYWMTFEKPDGNKPLCEECLAIEKELGGGIRPQSFGCPW